MSTEFGRIRRIGAHRAPYKDLPRQPLGKEPCNDGILGASVAGGRPAPGNPDAGPDTDPAVPGLRPRADLHAGRCRPRRPALARRVPGLPAQLASDEVRGGDDRADVPPARRGSRRVPLAGGIPQVVPPETWRHTREGVRTQGEVAAGSASRPSRSNSSRRRSGPSSSLTAASATRAPPRSCGAGSVSTTARDSDSAGTPAR